MIDTFANSIVGWKASRSAKTDFVLNMLEQALYSRRPAYQASLVHHSDSKYVFASLAWVVWITTRSDTKIKISMDRRGRYLDNIFVERLRRSLKQEAVYLHELQDGLQAIRVIDSRIGFPNAERPHTALEKRRPDDVYGGPHECKQFFGTIGHVIRCSRVSGLEVKAFQILRALMKICRSGPVRIPAPDSASPSTMVFPT